MNKMVKQSNIVWIVSKWDDVQGTFEIDKVFKDRNKAEDYVVELENKDGEFCAYNPYEIVE